MVRPRHANVAPGHHIYAYCNVKTHQVLYSLTRTLQHRQLQQLPDTGANNNPPALRKDLWRPLWSVHLPDSAEGIAQGLEAYRMLREFRTLHETTWEPPKSMSVPYTAKQIEKLEKRLDERGGSKKENAHDLIARKKWKMRVKMVMDQKTNSIADLAAVLLKQEREVEKQIRKKDEARRADAEEMAELEKGGAAAKKKLLRNIDEWAEMKKAREEDRRWRKLNAKIDAAKLTLAKMEFAVEHVPQAKKKGEEAETARLEREEARMERERIRIAAEQKAREKRRKAVIEATRVAREKNTTPTEVPAIPVELTVQELPEDAIPWTEFLPSYPLHLKRAPLTASKTRISSKDTPKRLVPPIFPISTEGLTIRWANTLDAEYAAEWPALVRHEPMGIVRNTAPRADSETPFLEVADFKAMGWKSRKEGFPLEATLAEKVMERRKAMGLVEHPTLRNKLSKKEDVIIGTKKVENMEGEIVEAEESALERFEKLRLLNENTWKRAAGASMARKMELGVNERGFLSVGAGFRGRERVEEVRI